jgi:hypothetical protein
MATVSPVPQLSALYTLPNAPLPRQSPSWKSLRPATSWAAFCAVPSLLGRCSRSRGWPLWLDEDDDFLEWPPGVLDEVEACDERELEGACDGREGCETMSAVLVWPPEPAATVTSYAVLESAPRRLGVSGRRAGVSGGRWAAAVKDVVRCACPQQQAPRNPERRQCRRARSQLLLLPMRDSYYALEGPVTSAKQLSVGDPGRETRSKPARRILESLPPARGCRYVKTRRPMLPGGLGQTGSG